MFVKILAEPRTELVVSASSIAANCPTRRAQV
jgi:hypothetical protein